jgi:hypothetical protein
MKNSGLLVIDFESHYDKDYSLSKMPTHQYIRDPRWKCLGCGFQWVGQTDAWYDPEPTAFLGSVDWDRTIAVAHNAKFDGSVLWERYGRKSPGFWLDTQLLATWAISQGHMEPTQRVSLAALAPLVGMKKGDTRAAVDAGGQVLADYGTEDVRIEAALLELLLGFRPPVDELRYMDMHVRYATEPVLELDEEILTGLQAEDPQEKRAGELLRKDANFKLLLESLGVEIQYKTTPKGRTKPAFAKSDPFMQELAEHDDPRVQEAAGLRLGSMSNLVRTRAQRFLEVGSPFPMPQNYYAAHTGRSGGADRLNVQNLPSKGGFREALRAPKGFKLVVGDSSQVEARGVGWQAGSQKLLNTFAAGDPYKEFGARNIYNKPADEITDDERFVAKAGLLGAGFSQAERGLQVGVRGKTGIVVPIEQCKEAIDGYRLGFPEVPNWWNALKRQVEAEGMITLESGRRMYYPDMDTREVLMNGERQVMLTFLRHSVFSKSRTTRDVGKLWRGSIAENRTQALCRDIVFWQLMHFHWEGHPRWRASGGADGWRLVSQTHDEGIAIAPDPVVDEARSRFEYWLTVAPPWADGFPLEGKVAVAQTYGDAKG